MWADTYGLKCRFPHLAPHRRYCRRFWSQPEIRDVGGMYKRLEAVDAELTLLGLTHNSNPRSMLARLTGLNDVDPLKTLADVVEPGELALRHHANPSGTQSTPLNRFVDAVVPDSDVARHFGELVDRYLAHHSDTEARDGLRAWMNLWIANDPKVTESVGKRQVAQDALPVSAMLARDAAEGSWSRWRHSKPNGVCLTTVWVTAQEAEKLTRIAGSHRGRPAHHAPDGRGNAKDPTEAGSASYCDAPCDPTGRDSGGAASLTSQPRRTRRMYSRVSRYGGTPWYFSTAPGPAL